MAPINGMLSKQITGYILIEFNGEVLKSYRYLSKFQRTKKVDKWQDDLARISTIRQYAIIIKPDYYVSE